MLELKQETSGVLDVLRGCCWPTSVHGAYGAYEPQDLAIEVTQPTTPHLKHLEVPFQGFLQAPDPVAHGVVSVIISLRMAENEWVAGTITLPIRGL